MKSIDNYRNGICRAYITFIFTVLPLFFVNMYFNIAQEKWLIFMISTIIFLFVMAVALLLSFSANDKKGKKSASFFYGWGLPEYAVIAFLLANIISLLASRDTNESLLGASSRHHGFLNFALYCLLLLILRNHKHKTEKLLSLLAVVGAVVSITAISQYLSFDPIGMYKGVTAVSVHRMISTVGNMNIFSGYLCLVTPLTVYLFMSSEKLSHTVLFGICTALDFAAGVAATSDGFYLGCTAGLISIPVVCRLTRKEGRRFFLAGMIAAAADFTIISAAKYIEKHHIIFSPSLKELDISIRPSLGITGKMMADSSMLLIIFLVFTLLYLLMLSFSTGEKGSVVLISDKVRKVILAIVLAVILGIFIKLFTLYPFDNEMGSYRGFIWNLAIRDFKGAGFFRHLVGYGQESVLELYRSLYRDEMVSVTGVIYDNVHCEPLEYLVTTGFLGLISYLTLIISSFVRIIKQEENNKVLSLLMLPLVSYFAQSFVSIAQSATTPIFFIILGMALSETADRPQVSESDSPLRKNGSRTRS